MKSRSEGRLGIDRLAMGSRAELASNLPAARRDHLARCLHSLGPRPLAFFLQQIIERGDDPLTTLESFAALDPKLVKALGARDFAGPIVIAGG